MFSGGPFRRLYIIGGAILCYKGAALLSLIRRKGVQADHSEPPSGSVAPNRKEMTGGKLWIQNVGDRTGEGDEGQRWVQGSFVGGDAEGCGTPPKFRSITKTWRRKKETGSDGGDMGQ